MMPEWKKQLLLQRRRLHARVAAPVAPVSAAVAEEELEYGPGIVDKLRSRFISLASLHQPAPGPLRRFASLEDLAVPPPATRGRPPARGPPTPAFKRAKSMETLALPDILINENVVIISADERPKPDTVKTFKRIFEPPSSRIPLRNGGTVPPVASHLRAKPLVTNGVAHPPVPLRSRGPPPDVVCPAVFPPSPVVSPPPPPLSPPVVNVPAPVVSTPAPVSKGWQSGPRSVVFDFRGKDVRPQVALRPAGPCPLPPVEDEPDLGEPEELPFPSGIVFEGENVVVGKGAILSTRNKKLKLRFDDCATATYEYPSEASLLLQDPEPPPSLRTCPALDSPAGTLGSYQPSTLSEEFRLGQRRATTPPPPAPEPPPQSEEEEDAAMLTPASGDQTESWSTSSSCHADLLF